MNNIDKGALREAADSVIQKYGSEWFETGRQLCTVHKSKIELISAANPATVLALLDELEVAEKRIAELEARTVTLPSERFRYGESDYDDGFVNGWNAHGIETKSALRAAGIGVKGE
ncbi:ead/Ea22-like family protein [Citrobacter werkmanii]